MRIARLSDDDAALVEAGAALFDAPPDQAWTARFLAAPGHHMLVALDEGERPLGFVSGVETTHPDKGTEMFLYELAVAAAERRRGIGRSLVEALAALARERGCYGMWVASEPDNVAALATYAAAGADPGESCVVLAWRFAPDAGPERAPRRPGATRPNRSMPAASVIPTLVYPDVRAAVAWLEAAFGFAERLRIGESHRSQLTCGDGAVIVADVRGERRPPRPGEVDHGVLVRIEGLDAHCARSRAHGARIVAEPASYPYGERQYTAEDLAGHQWTFSETLEDVDPASWGGELRSPAS